MLQPTPESIELVRIIMDDQDEPLVAYLAVLVGRVMSSNFDAVSEVLEEHRSKFVSAGAEDLLASLELDITRLFENFLNQEEKG